MNIKQQNQALAELEQKIKRGMALRQPSIGKKISLYSQTELDDLKSSISEFPVWKQIAKSEFWLCQKIATYYEEACTSEDRLQNFYKLPLSLVKKQTGEFKIFAQMQNNKRCIVEFKIVNRKVVQRNHKTSLKNDGYENYWPACITPNSQAGGSISNFLETIERWNVYRILDDSIIDYLKFQDWNECFL